MRWFRVTYSSLKTSHWRERFLSAGELKVQEPWLEDMIHNSHSDLRVEWVEKDDEQDHEMLIRVFEINEAQVPAEVRGGWFVG